MISDNQFFEKSLLKSQILYEAILYVQSEHKVKHLYTKV